MKTTTIAIIAALLVSAGMSAQALGVRLPSGEVITLPSFDLSSTPSTPSSQQPR
jgi:uncharacterized membrane protein